MLKLFEVEWFTNVHEKFRKPILRYMRTRVADEEVAEDLTQEVFLKAYRFRESYQERYALSTWLWTIARNTTTDYLRGSRVEAAETLAGAGPEVSDDLAGIETFPSPLRDAEELILEKDRRRSLLKMLRSLTRLQRRVLWLRVIHQLSQEEISMRLGLSVAAVKNLTYRAKLTLLEAGVGAGLMSPLPA